MPFVSTLDLNMPPHCKNQTTFITLHVKHNLTCNFFEPINSLVDA